MKLTGLRMTFRSITLLGRFRRQRLAWLIVLGVSLAGAMTALLIIRATLSAPGLPPSTPAQAAKTKAAPVALVYRGPASCAGCSEAVAALLQQSPYDFKVKYIGPGEPLKLVPASLAGAALYAQPGGKGSAEHALQALGPSSQAAIKDFVSKGGKYVGFCMGAYMAGNNPGMGLLAPGDTNQYSTSPGALATTTQDAVIPATWGKATRYMYVQDSPYIIASGVSGEQILSRYTNGLINALVKPYGKGRVGVVGSHPEADRSWYTPALWRADRDGLDAVYGLELIAAVMR